MKLDLDGIIPATFTPLLQTGDVNFDAIDKYVHQLVKDKIHSIFILGTSGEGPSFSIEERKLIAEKWMKVAKHRIKNIIVHVGTVNLVETKILAEHAESIGATAVSTLPSLFFKPSNTKCLASYIAEVAKAAPKTPLMYYHIPALTGVNLKMKELICEIEKIGVPTFAGIKYSALDLCDLGQCVDLYGEKYSFGYGCDEQVSAALLMGVQACIGSTYNYAPTLSHRIFDACKKSDSEMARKEQRKSRTFISYLIGKGLDVSLGKALMLPIKGIDFGPPRPPVLPTPKEKLDKIVKELKEMGFFEWNS